ncbi:MAG: TonB-dependent receptor [Kiritimatiellae bacterium]|nr:TonB-dependent receptor [Kiritimatiellia bacterium]
MEPAFSSGFRNPPEGAAALGHAGGKLTLTDDASLLSHNPAGLAWQDRTEVLASLTMVDGGAEFKSAVPPFDHVETRNDPAWLPALYAVAALSDGRYAAGIGLSSPYGQSTEWSQDSLFRYAAPYRAELRTLEVSPAFALQLTDTFSLGLAADLLFSDFTLRQIFPWSQAVGIPLLPDGEARFDAEGAGVSGHAGLQWKCSPRQVLGLVYRAPVDIDYDGDFSVSGLPAGFPLPSSSDFDTTIRFPSVIAAGYGFQATDTLRLGADVEWIEFSRYDRLILDAGVLNSLLPQTTIPQQWEDSWTLGVGADWRVTENWVLRGGYLFIESPIPSPTLAPTLPDADRHVVSLGTGYTWNHHRFDVAYAYSFFEDRNVTSSPQPLFNGSYELCSQLLGFSYGYTF